MHVKRTPPAPPASPTTAAANGPQADSLARDLVAYVRTWSAGDALEVAAQVPGAALALAGLPVGGIVPPLGVGMILTGFMMSGAAQAAVARLRGRE